MVAIALIFWHSTLSRFFSFGNSSFTVKKSKDLVGKRFKSFLRNLLINVLGRFTDKVRMIAFNLWKT